ncbi:MULTISPECIES: glycosyltransferase family 2 protein [Nostocales]|uniref:Glycosyl transferase n=3 Tax=Nostocales TaxID=1161 RepID=A0A0C1RFW7_9CYAN|nr:glycosyltransferase family 2 protein [Tolypothrix bouteillei]KAF3887066.1 glycosyltransferase family 2 protein [Tolypothrix bouteillei VB521301]
MKFSVVITTYNRLTLLQRAINSVLNQTFPCELVVADDCSLDGTQDYMKSLSAELSCHDNLPRLVYHRNEVNQGHAATVNAGVKASSGDWIKFLDDDDYLSPNCLEEMVRAIALRKSAVICSCIAAQVDINGVEKSRTPVVGPGLAYYVPQTDIHYGMLLELIPFGTPVQVACNREAFLQTGGWDVKLTSCDDIDSWIRIAQHGDAIFLNQCLAYRTVWTGGYDQKISLKVRLDTNILMKEKIHALVDEKYRQDILPLQDIKSYLKLHWTIVALKSRNLNSFINIFDPCILSYHAWRLLLDALLVRRLKKYNSSIRKLVLIKI